MIGHLAIFAEILACANRHSAVDLTRVGRDDLAAERTGYLHGATGLAACRGPDDGYRAPQNCLFLLRPFIRVLNLSFHLLKWNPRVSELYMATRSHLSSWKS